MNEISEVKMEGGAVAVAMPPVEAPVEATPSQIEGGVAAPAVEGGAPSGGDVDGGMVHHHKYRNSKTGRYYTIKHVRSRKHCSAHRLAQGLKASCPKSKHMAKNCRCYKKKSRAGRPRGSRSRKVGLHVRGKSYTMSKSAGKSLRKTLKKLGHVETVIKRSLKRAMSRKSRK
jgi:hypothetical protein